LSLEEYDQISQNLGRLYRINLTGGEPFLRCDIIQIAHLFYRKNNLKELSVPTNGYQTPFIVSAVKEILRRCPNLKLNINVSVDGPPDVHDRIRKVKGGYRKAMETIDELVKIRSQSRNLTVGMNATMMPQNEDVFTTFIQQIRKTHKHLDSICADFISHRLEGGLSSNRCQRFMLSEKKWANLVRLLSTVQPKLSCNIFGYLKEVLCAFEEYQLYWVNRLCETTRQPPIPCKAHKLFLVVRETGDVSYCEEREYIGNVKNNSLLNISNSQEAKIVSNSIIKGECACSQCIFQEVNLITNSFNPQIFKFNRRILGSFLNQLKSN